MTIEARIEKDSIGPNGVRLTTFVLKYPRFIHSEVMTHRCFSRNASSSRAIPFKRQMQMIKEDMAIPLEFRENKPGMQAGKSLSPFKQKLAVKLWRFAGHVAVLFAKGLNWLGVHKQYVNRLVEPFAHISVVLSSTEYSNFLALRFHSAAQPEIAKLAEIMWKVYSTNKPETLQSGSWHLPFISVEEKQEQALKSITGKVSLSSDEEWFNYHLPLIKMSVARCARVSYLTHEGKIPSQEDDFKLYDRLLGEQPIHASPAEHQACADPKMMADFQNKWSGNFRGWTQYRKTLKGENITTFEGPLG